MNHSIYSADRSTHLKIVVIALVAGTAVGFAISACSFSDDGYAQSARVIKAGKPVMAASALLLPAKKWNSGWLRRRNGRGFDSRLIISRLAQVG
jgi:allantoicase